MGMDEVTTGGGHFDVGGFGLYMGVGENARLEGLGDVDL